MFNKNIFYSFYAPFLFIKLILTDQQTIFIEKDKLKWNKIKKNCAKSSDSEVLLM